MIDNIKIIQGSQDFLRKIKNTSFQFFLISAYTKTAEIDNITSAGLAGLVEYTPPLDMEVLYYGRPLSMPDIPKMPSGPPSPVIITSAIKQLVDFPISYIDVGLKIRPKCPITVIQSKVAKSILEGSDIDAQELFNDGLRYASEVKDYAHTFILSECVPSGTTTAYAVSKALGYSCDDSFSSSNSDEKTKSLKRDVVNKAISLFGKDVKTVFDAIRYLGDPMQAFLSGMAVGLNQLGKMVILGGGTQMLTIYSILKKLDKPIDFTNIALMTTKWVAEDKYSDMKGLLSRIDKDLNAFYADFDFKESKFKNLNLYDNGYVKEGVGAGSIICYAYLKGISKKAILNQIEKLYKQVK